MHVVSNRKTPQWGILPIGETNLLVRSNFDFNTN